MATRVRTLEGGVAAAGYVIPAGSIVTLSDDGVASALIAAGRAVAVADATTCVTLFGTARWLAIPIGTGAIG